MSKVVYAKGKYVRRSPRKTRLVVDLVRGQNALNALDILKFTNKGSASDVTKVLASAIQNAVFNDDMNKADLVVVDAYVNEAPTFKRGMAVARGKYHQIKKRNCHIIIGVSEGVSKEEEVESKKSETKPKASKKESKADSKKKTLNKVKVKDNSKSKSTK